MHHHLLRKRGLLLLTGVAAVVAGCAIPVPPAKGCGAVQIEIRLEAEQRPGLDRIEPPPQPEFDPARRIEQRLMQRDGNRPDALDDAAPPQHRFSLLLVMHAGPRHLLGGYEHHLA